MRNFLLFFLLFITVKPYAQTVEAEGGIRVGTDVVAHLPGYSGTGYVTGFDAAGDMLTLTLNVLNKGVYNFYIRYASPSGDKFNFVVINGQSLGSVAFPFSLSFYEHKIGKVYLQKGENSIVIAKDWGFVEIDNIRVEGSKLSDLSTIATNIVTSPASAQADSLYNFLAGIYGKVVLSGQYGGEVEFNKIKNVSGKTPVIRGFDLMDYSPSRVERGSSSTEIENATAWSKGRGVVTFGWHWNAPKDLIDQTGKEWWRGFYTAATTFDLSKAMADPQSEEYTLIVRDIDAIAMQLKRLQAANIPVLWRPLHEAEGAWFWWGAKGPEPCKWLWKLLFQRLVSHHKINNLIWVWTSTDTPGALDWFPGHDVVDIISSDIYLPAGTYSSNFTTFENLVSRYQGKKMISLSENGPIPDPERLFLERAAWSWFCTWSGSFITDGITNSSAHINKVFNHDYVITLDEIDALTGIIATLDQRREDLKEDTVVLSGEQLSIPVVAYENPVCGNLLRMKVRHVGTGARLEIYNAQGQRELMANLPENVEHFEFEFNKTPGVYIIKVINTSSYTKTFRILKI